MPQKYQADAMMGEQAVMENQSDKVSKIIKALRLIRLIRIIKLYKYVVKSGSEMEEARMREQQKQSQNAQQAALNRELEPSRLGRSLSEALTRRLIILVLVLLMVLPAITYSAFDVSHAYGLRQLFWFGRSSCYEIKGDFKCKDKDWISKEGWYEHLRNFITAASAGESESLRSELLWIHVPDFERQGVIGDIRNVTNRLTDYPLLWKKLDVVEATFDGAFPSTISNFGIVDDLEANIMANAAGRTFEEVTGGFTDMEAFIKDQYTRASLGGSATELDSLMTVTESPHYVSVNGFASFDDFYAFFASDLLTTEQREALAEVYSQQDYFSTLELEFDEFSKWMLRDYAQSLTDAGMRKEVVEFDVSKLKATIE